MVVSPERGGPGAIREDKSAHARDSGARQPEADSFVRSYSRESDREWSVGDYDVLAALACARGLGLLPPVTGHCSLSHGLPWRTWPELAARDHGTQSHAAGNGVCRRGAATITRQAWWAAGGRGAVLRGQDGGGLEFTGAGRARPRS